VRSKPLFQWKQHIKDCEPNEHVKAMEQSEKDELYESEKGLLQYFVAGAK
jgi:hypothetical protein